jgi:hypothetical protein
VDIDAKVVNEKKILKFAVVAADKRYTGFGPAIEKTTFERWLVWKKSYGIK